MTTNAATAFSFSPGKSTGILPRRLSVGAVGLCGVAGARYREKEVAEVNTQLPGWISAQNGDTGFTKACNLP